MAAGRIRPTLTDRYRRSTGPDVDLLTALKSEVHTSIPPDTTYPRTSLSAV
jgi:hypothetical protein